jgi:glycosyltransferase involved in cell wall biosynthesis
MRALCRVIVGATRAGSAIAAPRNKDTRAKECVVMRTVSVIVPTYNCSRYLSRALHSIAAQTYPLEQIEILVIDDGSTDDTAHCVAAFIERSLVKTRYIPQQNAGPAAARNHGLRLAGGELVAFLDADDWWQPEKLARQIPMLHGRIAFAYCDSAILDTRRQPRRRYRAVFSRHRDSIVLPLFCQFFLALSSIVATRTALAAVGEFDERLRVGEDREFLLRLAYRFYADYVAEPLVTRRLRADGLREHDYALNARNDLKTLTGFVHGHPEFGRRNRAAINQRIASYRHEFARWLLAEDRRGEAIVQLVQSLRASANSKSLHALSRALVPPLRAAS